MKKAGLLLILVVATQLAVSVMAQAQQLPKVARIGFLDVSTAAGSAVIVEAFRQELSLSKSCPRTQPRADRGQRSLPRRT
jgi:hypothetical protein